MDGGSRHRQTNLAEGPEVETEKQKKDWKSTKRKNGHPPRLVPLTPEGKKPLKNNQEMESNQDGIPKQ